MMRHPSSSTPKIFRTMVRRPSSGCAISCNRTGAPLRPSWTRPPRSERGRRDEHKDQAMSSTVAVIGLGYVGLPLVVEFGKHMRTIGFDIHEGKVAACKAGGDRSRDLSD